MVDVTLTIGRHSDEPYRHLPKRRYPTMLLAAEPMTQPRTFFDTLHLKISLAWKVGTLPYAKDGRPNVFAHVWQSHSS